MPNPPHRGIAWSWTSRSRTPATAPTRRAAARTTGMTRYVRAAATSRLSPYSRTSRVG